MQGIRIFMLCMMMRLTALMTYCWMACVLASCVGSASSDAIEVNLLHRLPIPRLLIPSNTYRWRPPRNAWWGK